MAPAQELPQTSDPSVSTFGGNIAVLDDDVDVNFSNVDLYAQEGAGVDCVDACFSESSTSTSNSNYFIPDTPDGTDAYGREFEIGDGGSDVSALDTGIGTRESAIGVSSPTEARGVNENQDLSALQAEVSTTFDVLKNLESTSTLWTHEWTLSDGKIDNFAPDQGEAQDYVLSDQLGGSLLGVNGTGNEFTDLNIIYINTNGNDFSIGNSNFILDGQEGQDFIFLLNSGQNFLVTQSKLLVGPELDLFSALWFVSGDEKRTIDFSQSESNGFSFWNHSPESVIQANNYRACGQWVAENIQDWNNFSVDRCAYSNASPPPPEVPLPASFPLILSGLFGLGLMARRR